MTDASAAFAENAFRTGFADLPDEAVRVTRLDLIDYLACVLGGSRSAGIPEIVGLARELGGGMQARLFVHGGCCGLLEACLANGAMAHALDYDSTHESAFLHPSVHVFSAALTLADQLGGISGRDLLTSVALGSDLVSRLGLAYPAHPAGFMWTMVYGYLGSALAASKLLGLDPGRTVSALGLSYAQAAGSQQGNVDGTLDKRMMVGFAARGGVMAALMAKKGISGARNSIEGPRGIYHTYAKGTYDRHTLLSDLGRRYHGAGVSFKAYPACRFNHGHVDAAMALAIEQDLRPDEIERVTVHIEREGHSQVIPLDVKRNPRTVVDAQFSMPYTVASALVRRRLVIDDFTPEAIVDPVVLAVSNKVSPVVDTALADHVPPAAVVEVRTARGTFVRRVEYPFGHPKNPIKETTLVDKLRNCAANAAAPFSDRHVDEIVDAAQRVEELQDVRDLTTLLSRT